MGRYYDVNRIAREFVSLGDADKIKRPSINQDETLVGIVLMRYPDCICAIAPELNDDRYNYWCTKNDRPDYILHVQLYKLESKKASRIPDGPSVQLINFSDQILPAFSSLYAQEFKGLAETFNKNYLAKNMQAMSSLTFLKYNRVFNLN